MALGQSLSRPQEAPSWAMVSRGPARGQLPREPCPVPQMDLTCVLSGHHRQPVPGWDVH